MMRPRQRRNILSRCKGVMFSTAVIAVFVAGCGNGDMDVPEGVEDADIPVVSDPDPEVVSADVREGLSGNGYAVWIDCRVRNDGDTGDIRVEAELTGNGSWEKDVTVSIGEGAEELIEIEFPEAKALEEGISGFEFICRASPA